MAGRIESYLHSDKSVPNKGGSLVRVVCTTDFAARTDLFIEFAKSVAKLAFAASASTWEDVIEAFPDLEDRRKAVSAEIKEQIAVDQIVLMTV